MLNLLKLDKEVINKLKTVGESFNKQLFGEKTLRQFIRLNGTEQKLELEKLFQKVRT